MQIVTLYKLKDRTPTIMNIIHRKGAPYDVTQNTLLSVLFLLAPKNTYSSLLRVLTVIQTFEYPFLSPVILNHAPPSETHKYPIANMWYLAKTNLPPCNVLDHIEIEGSEYNDHDIGQYQVIYEQI